LLREPQYLAESEDWFRIPSLKSMLALLCPGAQLTVGTPHPANQFKDTTNIVVLKKTRVLGFTLGKYHTK
jgi:hypothetical protein